MSENLTWAKSSYSGSEGGSSCVEIAVLPNGGRAVRDSKDPDGPVLCFFVGEWRAFVRRLKAAVPGN
jgi:Domain of unknown function (DUF397)